uniref:Uncharacterized protein n=1 Tax=viral metagenome TaxID=1070528 RepID=A0A6C0C6R8_9ZZZZ
MEKFKNKYSAEILDDNTGEYYDKPVDCGGFPTRHAIKRAKEINVSKKDMILGRPCANNIEIDDKIITVLGSLLKPGQRTMICKNCKDNYISTYKGKNPLCKKCKPIILIERECNTCNIKYKTKFKGVNPNCRSCIKKNKMKKIDKEINKDIQNTCKHKWDKCPVGEKGKYKYFKCKICGKINEVRSSTLPLPSDKKHKNKNKNKLISF